MIQSRNALAALVASLVVAACVAGPPAEPASSKIAVGPSPQESPAASPATTPAGSPIPIDVTATTPRGSKLTVHGSGTSGRTGPAPSGAAWYEVDIEFCLAPTIQSGVPASMIRSEFALGLTDGRTIAPDAGPGASDEVFLSNETLKALDCVRGPLVFAVPLDGIPQYLQLVGPLGGMHWRVT
jgi:hypothetical protein